MAKKDTDIHYEIVKLGDLSGNRCSFYSVYLEDEKLTLFDKFIIQHEKKYPESLDDIQDRIELFAHKLGAVEKHFRFEGSKIGEFAHALRDYPKQYLRLYCIRYSSTLVILGGGAPKHKDVGKWQQDSKLTKEVRFMLKVADDIEERRKEGNIRFSSDFLDFEGDLIF